MISALAIAATVGLAGGIASPVALAQGSADTAAEQAGEAEKEASVVRSGGLWAWQTYGSFRKTKYEVTGIVSVVDNADGSFSVAFDEAFEVDEAGPFAVYVSGAEASSITKDNALRGATRLGSIRGTKGEQRFALPSSVDSGRIRSVVLHDTDKVRLAAVVPIEEGRVISSSHDWGDKSKTTKGSYEIVEREGARYIRFSEDFTTSRPPEPLRLLLSPTEVASASKRNAERGSRQIATLRSHKGEQEYRIPDEIDLEEYDSILLWCKPYKILFAASPIDQIDNPAED